MFGLVVVVPVESVLLFVVFMSVLNVWIWFKGGRWGLKYLVWVAPVVVWSGAITWVYWPDKLEYPSSQWAVLFFAFLLVTGVAAFAYRALYPVKTGSFLILRKVVANQNMTSRG